ncbi:GNAT family N-acetyltransferase [Falsirhodobacter sp. alg1]|uniref:GNAT family N-acetyltransferase n=1 Tax=Falsirhodobacter sp. alg1 TaxID=1472418 RepID=UPI0005EF30E5|nr:GNAT family N-acetyltransferase [Falsirhodobacter sp. alg1]
MISLTATPVLETERLVLRAPVPTDYALFAEFYATDRSRHMGGPLARDRAWRAFGHSIGHWAMRGFGMFVLTEKHGGTPLGMAGPWFPEGWPEREVGWSLWSAEHEGQGYASEAARAVLSHVWGNLGWSTAVSYIAPENTASAALAVRLGAVRDPDAKMPDVGDVSHVYRHPKPKGLA